METIGRTLTMTKLAKTTCCGPNHQTAACKESDMCCLGSRLKRLSGVAVPVLHAV